jgi:O-antigen ligase
MTQGEGIVDVVNTYLDVVLEYGLIGFTLYLSFFAIVVITIIHTLKKIEDKQSDAHLLGRVLLATQLAILFTITSVSSILVIPVVYWAIAGLSISYESISRGFRYVKQDTYVLPTTRLAGKEA